MAQQTTLVREATPGARTTPLRSSLQWQTHAEMCAFVPTCVRSCATCVRICERQHLRACEHRRS
jgi:hypothetical protein